MKIRNRAQGDASEASGPDELARELQRQRELAEARRVDELERVRAEAGHGRARADVAEESRLAELARVEREERARADAELARMYRRFRAVGERARIRSLMARSGEARALRLDQLRARNLVVLVPLLAGFGVWSTTGVQQGAARLMAVGSGSPVWWVLWGLEALLIGLVCWIIIVRARLSVSGGELSPAAERIGVGCLATSVFLNLIAALPAGAGSPAGWAVPGAMFAHAIGPVGAAVTAHLIGIIDRSISAADPWHEANGDDAPRLTDMDLTVPEALPFSSPVVGGTQGDAGAADPPETAWPVEVGARTALPVVSGAAASDGPDADGSGQDGRVVFGPVEQFGYVGPVVDEAERSAPLEQEPPSVQEAIAQALGFELVREAERYLSAHAEEAGPLRELPPLPGEREPQPPMDAGLGGLPATAHDDRSEQPGTPRDERPPAPGAPVAEPPATERPGHRPPKGRRAPSVDPGARLEAVRRLLAKEPGLSGAQIAARLGLPPSTARRLAAQVRQQPPQDHQDRDDNGGER